jgi:ATP synthase protein I
MTMPDDRPRERPDPARGDAADDPMLDAVQRKEARKQKARREGEHGLAFGLGLFGLVGWSVAVPTLIGVALGVWIDRRSGGPYSWTLMLLVVGVALGCVNAWYWVRKEMRRD